MYFKEITFVECEHEGDLEEPFEDLHNSGAVIIEYSINDEAETVKILVQVNNVDEFVNKFKKTESFNLSSLRKFYRSN